MLVDTPPRTQAPHGDLEALIEEARRRARRRRLGYLACAVGATAVAAAAYFMLRGDGGTKASRGPSASQPGGSSKGSDVLYLRTTTSDDHLIAVQTGTGQTTRLPIRLSCGDAMFCLVPTGRQLVIGSVGRTSVYDPARPGRPRAHHLGNGWIVIPSASPGKVWLGIHPGGTGAFRAFREETTRGRTTRTVHPQDQNYPAEAVRAGILFQARDSLRLWSFKKRRLTTQLPGPFAADAQGDLVASCGEPCPRYAVTNARTGDVSRISPPRGYRFQAGYEGAFSPNGSLLALPVVGADAHRPADERQSAALAIANPSTGVARAIPGSDVEPSYQAMSWSTSGRRLFFAAGGGTIMSYKLGSTKSSTLTKLPPGEGSVMQMAALRPAP